MKHRNDPCGNPQRRPEFRPASAGRPHAPSQDDSLVQRSSRNYPNQISKRSSLSKSSADRDKSGGCFSLFMSAAGAFLSEPSETRVSISSFLMQPVSPAGRDACTGASLRDFGRPRAQPQHSISLGLEYGRFGSALVVPCEKLLMNEV